MTSRDVLTTAAAAVEAVADLAAVEWDRVGGSELVEATLAAARVKALAEATLVALAERLETTGAAEELGWASAKDFLTHAVGGRKGAGSTLVRVAKQTTDLPELRQAMAEGAVSLAQASVIGGRVATLPHAAELRTAAAGKLLALIREQAADATDLDRGFPGVVHDLDPDGSLLRADLDKDNADRGAHHARFLSFTPDTLGGVRIKGYGSLEDIELIKTTLMPLSAPTTTEPGACGGDPDRHGPLIDDQRRLVPHGCPDPRCNHDGKDPRDHGVRVFDALLEACRRLQATDNLPHAHGTTARITVTIDYDDLTAKLDNQPGDRAGTGVLPSGDTISAAAVRRLACDAEIIPAVLGTQGQILDIGRSQRLVTTGLWNALVLRDRHCAFPGCTRPVIACEAHHITHWADGGTTSLDNLILLCSHHHHVVHRTPWRVAIQPDTRRPVWTPPPPIDLTGKITYHPARARPPGQAA